MIRRRSLPMVLTSTSPAATAASGGLSGRTASAAAWLLVPIGIPSFLCNGSIASTDRQLVQDRKTQSGEHPFSWDSTKRMTSDGGTLPISRFLRIPIPTAFTGGYPASPREDAMLFVKSSV